MYTTTDENGLLNNYGKAPKMYYAKYPNPQEQRRYLQQGVLGMTLVTSLLLMAFIIG